MRFMLRLCASLVALGALSAAIGGGARAAGERDWILWNTANGPTFGPWETRWIRLGERGPEVLAERTEPMASDGARVWSLLIARHAVPLRSCECEAGLEAPGCHDTGTSTAWSLVAIDLVDGTTTVLIPPESAFVGADPGEALVLVGSAGAHIFASRTRGASGCGPDTKPLREFATFDLGRVSEGRARVSEGRAAADQGRGPRDRRFVADRLPIALVAQAAGLLANAFAACETGFQKSSDEVRRDMVLEGWSLRVQAKAAQRLPERVQAKAAQRLPESVRDGGPLRIRWAFAAEAEYLACRETRLGVEVESAPMAEAGSLGLGSPPPDVVQMALAREQGEGTVVGFAALAVEGAARDTLLRRFRRAPSQLALEASEAAVKRLDGEQRAAHGRERSRAGDQAGALQAFGEALASDPELASAWAGRGRAKLLAGDLTGAKADLERAFLFTRDAATQAAVWYDLGQLAERAGDRQEARAAYTSASAIRPSPLIDEALARLP